MALHNNIPSLKHDFQHSGPVTITNSTTPASVCEANAKDTMVYHVYIENQDSVNPHRVRLRKQPTGVPASALTLADVNVPANSGMVVNIPVVDILKFAKGLDFDALNNQCIPLMHGWELMVDTPTATGGPAIRIWVDAYNFDRT